MDSPYSPVVFLFSKTIPLTPGNRPEVCELGQACLAGFRIGPGVANLDLWFVISIAPMRRSKVGCVMRWYRRVVPFRCRRRYRVGRRNR